VVHRNVSLQSHLKTLISTSAICAFLVCLGCSVAPYTFPDKGVRTDLQAIDLTRITVKAEFRYSPTLTSYVLPAGNYVPIRSDADGTYYESPRGVLVLPVAGSYVVEGGIYRRNNAKANYPFSVYVNMPGMGWTFLELHSMWGLDLNEKIECVPPYAF
jgi:hypothetical protein